jgi:hypothetical protein
MTSPAPVARSRAADLAALLLALAVGAAVASTLGSVRYEENPDEAYYLAYAGYLHEHGLAGLPTLFHDYVAEPERWLYPNPLRVGYIVPAALWTALFGAGFGALSWLSLVCHVLTVGLSYLFFSARLGPPRALAVAALVGFSPLLLAIARRAWLDAPATLAGAAVLWSFCAALLRPRRTAFVALGGLFGVGVLVKETTVLLALPCAALFAWERFACRRALPLAPFALALALPLCACFALWSLCAGDLTTLVSVIRIILVSPASNAYAQALGGGSAFRYPLDLLLLAPATTALGFAALGVAAWRLRKREAGDLLVWLALVLVALLVAYAPFTKNVRYVALAELPLRALCVCLLWQLAAAAGAGARDRAVAAGLLLVLCAADWLSFQQLFVRSGLYDPMTAHLLALRGLAPP